jgi:hypothetical protein
MKSRISVIISLLIFVIACGPFTPKPSAENDPEPASTVVQTDTSSVDYSDSPSYPLQGLSVSLGTPFAQNTLIGWDADTSDWRTDTLPLDIHSISNMGVLENFTNEQMDALLQNGFTVIQTNDTQFYDVRQQVSNAYGQPYYLSTDAAYHALHLTFDELLKSLEREKLLPEMIAITDVALQSVLSYIPQVEGTSLEEDVWVAASYLAVAQKLFNDHQEIDDRLEPRVRQQLEQIHAGMGLDDSVLIPDFTDDYGAYKPVGHYAGDPELEAYFRGMTWYGRVHFKLTDQSQSFQPSRAPLIITFALRTAEFESTFITKPPIITLAKSWNMINEILSFLIGPGDDAGPLEYAQLMDKVYGTGPLSINSLADDELWQQFLERSGELPSPQIHSTFVGSSAELEEEAGWRFMGQRFTLDAFILQNLLFDKVGSTEKPREVPSGLDVMAALGSKSAHASLKDIGETTYLNYPEQLTLLQQTVATQHEQDWRSLFYSGWLYAFLPQLNEKDFHYPAYMRTTSWNYKDLNSALGSWAELKHDTILYSKMPEPMGGGGPPTSPPAPAHIEPNPDVFYRLADVTLTLYEGLIARGISSDDQDGVLQNDMHTLSFMELLNFSDELASRFKQFGDIAKKELAQTALDQEDYNIIQSCLGPLECMKRQMDIYGIGDQQEMPPVPVIAAVSGAGETLVLEAGVGYLDRIFVAVPDPGFLNEDINTYQIAQGSVFTYFEFQQPRSNRLTDEEWRQLLDNDEIDSPEWIDNYILPGGAPTDFLAFRIGDYYMISEEGTDLNVRQTPSLQGNAISKLYANEYIEIVDGPIDTDNYTWWKIKNWSGDTSGWVVENQEWYIRAGGH